MRCSIASSPLTRARFAAFSATLAILAAAPAAHADDGNADDSWFGADKVLHVSVSTVIAAGAYTAATPLFDARYPPLLLAAGATLAIGATKEGYDAVSGGDPSWKDFTWDAIGTVAGLAIAYSLDLALRGVSDEHPLLGLPHAPAADTRVAPSAAAHAHDLVLVRF